MANKTKVFAAQLRGMPDFIAVFKLLANLRLLMCMLVALIMGAGIGLISTFLFWHLQVNTILLWKWNSLLYFSRCDTLVNDLKMQKMIIFSGLWRNSYTFWHCIRYQSPIRDGRILSCYQTHRKNWTCKSTRIWSFMQLFTLFVHFLHYLAMASTSFWICAR